jgi:hypothetical protein
MLKSYQNWVTAGGLAAWSLADRLLIWQLEKILSTICRRKWEYFMSRLVWKVPAVPLKLTARRHEVQASVRHCAPIQVSTYMQSQWNRAAAVSTINRLRASQLFNYLYNNLIFNYLLIQYTQRQHCCFSTVSQFLFRWPIEFLFLVSFFNAILLRRLGRALR